MYFVGAFCSRCDYRRAWNAPWQRKVLPVKQGAWRKPGDSSVRIIRRPET